MDLLANYDDENTEDNSISDSPKQKEVKGKTHLTPTVLENEWLSFEQMIAPGGGGNTDPVKSSDFLVNGIVAYPGMKSSQNPAESGLALEEQSSASNDSDAEEDKPEQSKDLVSGEPNDAEPVKKEDEDDDAFFKLRKQVKERDRSSSSDRSGSTGSSSPSSSRSCSPSPPHLSPVNSIKSHASDPPDLTERDGEDKSTTAVIDRQDQDKKEDGSGKLSDEKKRPRSKDRKRSRSRDRKRSHRSKRDHSSKSKRRRSRSRSSKDRKRRRSRDHHRHKDKKSRDRKSSRDEKRSKSRERKDSKSENRKSEVREHKDSTSEKNATETKSSTDVKCDIKDNKDSKSEGHRKRSRSRDRKDKKKDRRRSRSRHRHRSRSRDRRSRDRKKSRSKERKRSRSKDRKRKHRSRSRDRRSRSRHRSRERHSRSRSRERLRSRSPVMGRKLTFKEQMRKEFINASKEMSNQEHKVVSDLDALRKPGEALRPSDLLKGVKLNSGESVTPQMALIQTMAAMHKKAQELTGVEVPKYYNPAAVNPLKYAEQVQKRKLLWSKKTDENQKEKNDHMETQWKSAFVSTEDNKTASKFRKLMGMKGGEGQSSAEELPEDLQKLSEEQQRKQAELFQRLDQDYQFARMTTHTQRGVGLGFSTTIIDPNHPQNPP